MKLARWLTGGLLGVVLGCGCPKDVYLGTLVLNSPSFWPYTGRESLTFATDRGQRLILVADDYSEEGTRQRQAILCDEGVFDRQETYYRADRTYHFSFKAASNPEFFGASINLFLTQDLNRAARDTVFYEVLSVNVYANGLKNQEGTLNVLTNDRGHARTPGAIPAYVRAFRFIPDTLIGNTKYQNVYTRSASPSLLYSRERGLVAIRTANDEWWHLKEINRR